MNIVKRISYAGLTVATLMLLLTPAAARAPLLDEQRGVLTLAPVLEKVTPAVVSVAVATRIPGDDDNPIELTKPTQRVGCHGNESSG